MIDLNEKYQIAFTMHRHIQRRAASVFKQDERMAIRWVNGYANTYHEFQESRVWDLGGRTESWRSPAGGRVHSLGFAKRIACR